MLLAAEGGGFFSSSASGYSKGLTLLFLGLKNKDKPMKVSPWNQYQLVDQDSDPDIQLASVKNRLSHGCPSFVCFGRASTVLEVPPPLKVGPVQRQDVLTEPPASDKGNDKPTNPEDDNIATEVALKGSLKKPSNSTPVSTEDGKEHEALGEKRSDIPCHTERRKLQWTDACGRELVEIREFELRISAYVKKMKRHKFLEFSVVHSVF